MQKTTQLFFLALCLVLQTTGNAQLSVKQSHPRILLDTALILKLQSRKASNTAEWQEMSTRINGVSNHSSAYIMNNVYGGEQYAFMYALSFYASGNIAHRDSAVSLFKEYFNNYTTDSTMYYDSGYESRSTLVEIATLYDWLYTYLTPSFRNTVKTRLVLWANWILTKPNIYGIWGSPYYYEGNNYTIGHFVGITSVGFAIQSEDAVNGNKFIHTADSIRPFLMNFANTRLKGGDAVEGWGYGAGYAINYLKALAIFKTATTNHIDHFTATTYDEDAVKFLAYASLPNLTHMLPEGDWARESTGELWEFHRLVADLSSTYSDDATTQKTALFWANEAVPLNHFAVTSNRWFPFLFSNKEITPVDYRTLPAYQTNYIYTDTIGTDQFIRRTGWNGNSQWVSYHGGGRYADHSHNGSGHFSVYENGWLLIDKNIYDASGIQGADSMHNCIHYEKMNNFDMYAYHEPAEHTVGVRRDLNADYSYLWTNSTPIYKARSAVYNCVDKNERQFLYLPDLKKIAIFDIAKTTNNNKKWFGLNYNASPSVSSDSSYTYYSNGQKTAYVNTCYPLNKSVKTFGRSVRVGNKTQQQKDYFMHLVSVLPSADAAPSVASVNRDNGRVILSDFYGSYHTEATKDYCILFAGDDNAYSHDSLIYQVPSSIHNLHSYIAGLKLSTNYYVSHSYPLGAVRVRVSLVNEPNSTLYTTSSGGILSFEFADPVGIKNNSAENNQYHVFYNKSDEEILIETIFAKNQQMNVSVYDVLGKLIISENSGNSKQATIATGGLDKGIYMVSIKNETGTYTKKIIVY